MKINRGLQRGSTLAVVIAALAITNGAAAIPPGYVPLSEPIVVGPGDQLAWPGMGSATAIAAGTGGVQGVLWTYDPGTGREVFAARSADYGVSWAAPVSLGYGHLSDAGSNLAISSANTWMTFIGAGLSLRLKRSIDNGATWEEQAVFPFDYGILRFGVAAGTGGQWIAAWDVLTGSPTVRKVHVSRSTDDGVTWSEPEAFAEGRLLALASDSDGAVVILWQATSGGSFPGSPVFSRQSSDMGVTWSPTAYIHGAESNLDGWALAGDGLGNWMAVGRVVYDVIRVFSRDGGYTWEAPEVEEDLYRNRFHAAADGHGNWLLMWDAGSTRRFSRSPDHGHTWLPHQDLPLVGWHADVVMDSDGHWSFVGNTGGAENNVAVVRSEVDTGDPPAQPDVRAPISSSPPVALGPGSGYSYPALAGDDSGRWGVAWLAWPDILWRTTHDGGRTWNETTIVPRGAFPSGRPFVAARPGGTWLLAYRSTGNGIVVHRSTDGGGTWGEPTVVHTPARPPVAIVHTGGANWLMLFWDNDGLNARRSLDDGQTWQAPMLIGPTYQSGTVRAASDRQGGCTVSWLGSHGQSHTRTSADWGATWSEGSLPGDYASFVPELATDRRGQWGALHISDDTWPEAFTNLYVSNGQNPTWTARSTVHDGHVFWGALTADPHGNWLVAMSRDHTLTLYRSADGGHTWLAPHAFAPFVPDDFSFQLNLDMDDHGNWLAVWEANGYIYAVNGTIPPPHPLGWDVDIANVPAHSLAGLIVLAALLTAAAVTARRRAARKS